MNIHVIKKRKIDNVLEMDNCIRLISYTTITTTPKGMKVKFSENISENLCCAYDNLPSMWKLSKGQISNILRRVSCVKLKLATLVVGDVEQP